MSSGAGRDSMRRGRIRAFLLFVSILAGSGAVSGNEIEGLSASSAGGPLSSVTAGSASSGDAAARKLAQDAGIDLGSVIETVRHHVGSAGEGVLVSEDRLYRAEFTSTGFGLALRDVISDAERSERTRAWLAAGGGALAKDPAVRESGLPAESSPSGLPAEAIPFQSDSAFRAELASVEMGGRRVSSRNRLWSADHNVASREVAAGVTERVTAREGRVVWDFVLENPVSTGLTLDVRVHAAGAPVRTRTAVKGHPELPGTAWRYPVADGRAVRVGEIVVKDAAGRSLWRGLPEASLGRMRLRIPAAVLDGAVYPVTVDPTVGPEYSASDPVYGPSSGIQAVPSVAWNGSNFLVSWQDHRSGGNDIYASRVSGAGAVLDASGITVSTAANDQFSPAVASDGSNFLVAWQDFRSGTSNDIYASRISGTGAVLDASGIAVSIAANSQTFPALAWNGSNFLVAWHDLRSGTSNDIYASRVSGAGVVLDASGIAVSAAASNQSSPAVAWNGSNFLVAWLDSRSGSNDIYAARVTGAGVVLDASGIAVSTSTGSQEFPSVAWNGSNFLVAWQDSRSGTNSDVYASRVSSAGVVLDASGIAVSTAANSQTSPAVASDGSNFLVAWKDSRSGVTGDIYASRVSGAGAVLDASGIAVSTAANGQVSPSVAWNGSNFLVAWSDSRSGADIYASRVSGAGVVLDASGIAVSTAANGQASPSLAWNGTIFFVAWEDRRSGTSDIYASRVSGAGVILDASGIAVSTATNQQFYPMVASDGSNFFVAWEDRRSGTSDIYASRVSGAGAVLDASGFIVSTATATSNQVFPSVAFDGSNFLVTWQDFRSGTTNDIYASRVSGAGAVLDASGIAVSTAPNDQFSPSVAWNGSNYLVVWTDTRNGGAADVYGARVSPGGVLLDPAGISIATSAAAEDAPSAIAGPTGRVVVAYRRFAQESPYGSDRIFLRNFDDPANDLFVNAATISGTSGIADGVNAGASKEVGEPNHAGNTGGASVWYRWTAPANGVATFDTIGSQFNTLLGVYTGATVSTLTTVAFNDDIGAGIVQSRASFNAFSGTVYRIAVDGKNAVTGPIVLNWSLAVDTTPPDTTITGGPSGSVNTTTASFTFTATEAGATFACQIDGAAFSACTSPKTFTGLAQGSHTFNVRALDVFGNPDASPASRTWTVDTAPPDTTIVTGPSGTVNTTTASFTFTASEAGSTFSCQIDGGGFSACTTPKAFTGLSEGSHTFQVQATDAAGNTDASPASRTWTIDTTAPQTTIDSGPSGMVQSSSATFTFSATEAGSTFACQIDGGGFSVCTSPKAFTGLPDGSHTFQVRATDSVGNVDASPASRSWTIDATGPSMTIIRPTSGIWVLDSQVLSAGTLPIVIGPVTVKVLVVDNESGIARFTFEVDGTPVTSGVTFDSATKTYSFLYDASAAGMHTITARATNGSGLSSSTSTQLLAIPT